MRSSVLFLKYNNLINLELIPKDKAGTELLHIPMRNEILIWKATGSFLQVLTSLNLAVAVWRARPCALCSKTSC